MMTCGYIGDGGYEMCRRKVISLDINNYIVLDVNGAYLSWLNDSGVIRLVNQRT